MGNSFRQQPTGTLYPEQHTPVTEDLLQVGLLFAFAIIAFSFILIIPGIRGSERYFATIRVFSALWVGAVLLVCNYGSWYSDSICTRTQYRSHVTPINRPQTIQAQIGLSIGLRGINVSLLETPCSPEEVYEQPFKGEMINYNERFGWGVSQGRLDFGLYGGQFNQEFRAAKYRGMPYPIEWIAEYFIIDGDQIRWYRKFRVAGFFTQIFLWLAFATYLISILLFIGHIRSGAIFMLYTGLLMCLAVLTYGVVIINDPPLKIPFQDDTIRPQFNYSFWITLFTGVVLTLAAVIVMIADIFWPREIAKMFHHGTIADDSIFEGYEDDEDTEIGLDEYGIVKERKISTQQLPPAGAGRKISMQQFPPAAGAGRKISLGNISLGNFSLGGGLEQSAPPRGKKMRRRGTLKKRDSDVFSRGGSQHSTVQPTQPEEEEEDVLDRKPAMNGSREDLAASRETLEAIEMGEITEVSVQVHTY